MYSDDKIFFNAYELAKEVNTTVSTLKKNFQRKRKALAKQGIYIDKYGRGDDAVYTVDYYYENPVDRFYAELEQKKKEEEQQEEKDAGR